MQIKRLKFPEADTTRVGLKPIDLERLGNLVVLIGKNGSGKTRILNLIENYFTVELTLDNLLSGNIIGVPNEIFRLNDTKKLLNSYYSRAVEVESLSKQRQAKPSDSALSSRYTIANQDLKLYKNLLAINPINKEIAREKSEEITKKIESELQRIKNNYFKRIRFSEIKQLQNSISEEEKIQTFESLIETVTEQLEYNEIGSISKTSLQYLRKLPNQLITDWIECKNDQKKLEKRVSFMRYKSLKGIFENIFGKTLDWEIRTIHSEITPQVLQTLQNGIWSINEREFNYDEFSDGEKSLFIYSLLFFLMAQNTGLRLKESIVIIDEPELHLHADAEIELLSNIRKVIGDKGQLWIATHSINILSHVNFDEVFVVRNNKINHPSRTTQRDALSELIKIQDRVDKLSEFLSSISEWSYVNFMIECFMNPEVIEVAQENDPQVKSLVEILNLKNDGKKSLLLDCGAGKGRLFDRAIQGQTFSNSIEYSALEPNKDFHDVLIKKGVKKVFSAYSELEINSFDFIVLCNVLHEIPITEWVSSLNTLIDSLRPFGYLIILEAKLLTKGEFIEPSGYLLLDEQEIKYLFKIADSIRSLNYKEEKENINCVLLQRESIFPLTVEHLLETMKFVESNSFTKIKNLKKHKPVDTSTNNKFGRNLAFLSQLYINARVAQEELGEEEKPIIVT